MTPVTISKKQLAAITSKRNGLAAIITAIGATITPIGLAIIAAMNASQSAKLNSIEKTTIAQVKTLEKVEHQGNSVALEQKRVTAAALRAAAAVTKKPEDELKAKDAETLYEEAKRQAEQNTKAK
jgi:Mn2+/Fe2+ NRAMP family transporter